MRVGNAPIRPSARRSMPTCRDERYIKNTHGRMLSLRHNVEVVVALDHQGRSNMGVCNVGAARRRI